MNNPSGFCEKINEFILKSGNSFGEIPFVFLNIRAIIQFGKIYIVFSGGLFVENALRMIVEADCAARKDVEEAKLRREHLTAELTQSKVEINRQHQENAEKTVEKVRVNMQTKVQTAVAALEQKTAAQAARMQALYDEKSNEWVETIFHAVTKE